MFMLETKLNFKKRRATLQEKIDNLGNMNNKKKRFHINEAHITSHSAGFCLPDL